MAMSCLESDKSDPIIEDCCGSCIIYTFNMHWRKMAHDFTMYNVHNDDSPQYGAALAFPQTSTRVQTQTAFQLDTVQCTVVNIGWHRDKPQQKHCCLCIRLVPTKALSLNATKYTFFDTKVKDT